MHVSGCVRARVLLRACTFTSGRVRVSAHKCARLCGRVCAHLSGSLPRSQAWPSRRWRLRCVRAGSRASGGPRGTRVLSDFLDTPLCVGQVLVAPGRGAVALLALVLSSQSLCGEQVWRWQVLKSFSRSRGVSEGRSFLRDVSGCGGHGPGSTRRPPLPVISGCPGLAPPGPAPQRPGSGSAELGGTQAPTTGQPVHRGVWGSEFWAGGREVAHHFPKSCPRWKTVPRGGLSSAPGAGPAASWPTHFPLLVTRPLAPSLCRAPVSGPISGTPVLRQGCQDQRPCHPQWRLCFLRSPGTCWAGGAGGQTQTRSSLGASLVAQLPAPQRGPQAPWEALLAACCVVKLPSKPAPSSRALVSLGPGPGAPREAQPWPPQVPHTVRVGGGSAHLAGWLPQGGV